MPSRLVSCSTGRQLGGVSSSQRLILFTWWQRTARCWNAFRVKWFPNGRSHIGWQHIHGQAIWPDPPPGVGYTGWRRPVTMTLGTVTNSPRPRYRPAAWDAVGTHRSILFYAWWALCQCPTSHCMVNNHGALVTQYSWRVTAVHAGVSFTITAHALQAQSFRRST